MSLSFGFYNSLNGDRKYNSVQMSQIFDGIINDGIFMSIGSKMMVTPNKGMTVSVGTGRAWFNGTWTYIDAPYLVTLSNSEVLQNRIDAIVLEVNASQSVRANSIKVVKGTPATSPAKPALTNTDVVHQYPLAYIKVNKAVEEIKTADIENAVGLTPTPFVTGILKTMDINALVTQWQAQWSTWMADLDKDATKFQNDNKKQWNDWFAEIKDELGDNAVGNLKVRVDALEKNKCLPLAGGVMTGPIEYKTETRQSIPIRIEPQNVDGNAMIMGDGGLTILGSGESALNLYRKLISDENLNNGTERLYLASDTDIFFAVNCNNIDSRIMAKLGSTGWLTLPVAITIDAATNPRLYLKNQKTEIQVGLLNDDNSTRGLFDYKINNWLAKIDINNVSHIGNTVGETVLHGKSAISADKTFIVETSNPVISARHSSTLNEIRMVVNSAGTDMGLWNSKLSNWIIRNDVNNDTYIGNGNQTTTMYGSVVIQNSTDASGTAASRCALKIGDIKNTHLEFDGNEILAKSNDTTPSKLMLNADGGEVTVNGKTIYKSGDIIPLTDGGTGQSQIIELTSSNDMDDIITPGLYHISNSSQPANIPYVDGDCIVEVFGDFKQEKNGLKVQRAIFWVYYYGYLDTAIRFNIKNDGWTDWFYLGKKGVIDNNNGDEIKFTYDDSGCYLRPDNTTNDTYLGSRLHPWYKIWAERLEVTESRIKCQPIYDNTMTSSPNVYVNSEGLISRATGNSSQTIKHDIKPLEVSPIKPYTTILNKPDNNFINDISAGKLYNINLVSFKYNDGIITDENDPRIGKDLPGIIIENLNEVYPIAVDKPDPDDVKTWSWNAQYLIPPMLKLIQDQKKQLDKLQEKVDKLS